MLLRALDRFRGGGDAAVTVPSLDGAFRPNQTIETANVALAAAEPDNLVVYGDRLLFSSGSDVIELAKVGTQRRAENLYSCQGTVACLAAHVDGGIAIGLATGGLIIKGGVHDGKRLASVGKYDILCPTALRFVDENRLLLSLGSRRNASAEWKRDLLKGNASGSAWSVDLRSGRSECLADGLAWPNGIAGGSNNIVVSESWKHRLIDISNTTLKPVLTDLPGYPARLAEASDGGYWLALFAPRSQLVEFVLREHRFRKRMMVEIENEFWVAPALRPATDYREPLQSGAIKQLGELKASAPSRSYGLIAKLNEAFTPTGSFHSRADGRRHGITSCCESEGQLFASSKGGDVIIEIDLTPRKELSA